MWAYRQLAGFFGGAEGEYSAAARGGEIARAAAAYRFRDGILRAADSGASFKQMMREVNGAVEKYRK